MVVIVCLHITQPHYHHYADLSESIELLTCFSDTFCLQCLCMIKSILSIIFLAICGAVRIQLTQFSYDHIENKCTFLLSSSNRKYDPFAIAYGKVMKQWHALYFFFILLCQFPRFPEQTSIGIQGTDFKHYSVSGRSEFYPMFYSLNHGDAALI